MPAPHRIQDAVFRWLSGTPVSRCLYFIAAFNGLLILWLLVRPGGPALVAGVDNVAQFAGPLLALLLCMAYPLGRPVAPIPASTTWAVRLAGLYVLLFALGQIVYTLYEQVFGYATTPVPSWADPFFLAADPLMLVAILLLPGRPLPLPLRMRLALDGLIAMASLATFSWYFILGPTILQGADSALGEIIGTAYPLDDLVLLTCLFLLSARTAGPDLRTAVRILWTALGLIIVTDSIYDYQSLHGTYDTGHVIPDVGWPLGYMLVAAAILALRRAGIRLAGEGLSQPRPDPAPVPIRRMLVPYALIPAVAALMGYVHQVHGDARLVTGVYAGGGILVALLLIRQVFAILENRQLYRSLHQAYEQLRANNDALAAANARLENLATTDPLTDLLNHRALIAALDLEIERARRYGRSCAVLFLDLDHFKAHNDGYGHQAGDGVLREFADVVRANLRSIDTLGRWGGEEFLAILPETDGQAALLAAEHVRMTVAAHRFTAGGTHLTCSIGVAAYPGDAEERSALVAAADRAMYSAKLLGRNQARAADDTAMADLEAAPDRAASREETALAGTVEALAALVNARDHYIGGQSPDIGTLAQQIALACDLQAAEARMIGLAGRLCDVGKVAVPDAVLRKPAQLADIEWGQICHHSVVGADVVRRVPALRALAPLIRAHHERWDGGGYPDGLRGDAIPLGARIISVAAAFRAITTERPYRQARDRSWALAELRRCAGTQFDPAVVAAIERVLQRDHAATDQRQAG